MRKFTINCDYGGRVSPTSVFVGDPKEDHHPLHFQSDFLSKERGGVIPVEVMEAMSKLKNLATTNDVSFEDLCVYALGSVQQNEKLESEAKKEDQIESNDDSLKTQNEVQTDEQNS